jgi:hypothetical protein
VEPLGANLSTTKKQNKIKKEKEKGIYFYFFKVEAVSSPPPLIL